MSDHDSLAAALVAALADLTNVAKAHKADTGKYGYSFANIADLIAETRPVLAAHGLVALTPVHEHVDGLACTVTILHRSGERLDFGPTPFPAGKDAQSTGSWITYMRRYCLLAALGMGAEDDDGAGAKAAPARQERKQEPAGESVAKLKEQLLLKVQAAGVPGDATEHARTIWSNAEVKAVNGRVVDALELDVLNETARTYLDDLKAVNA